MSKVLSNTAKVEIQWSGPDGSSAANILYVLAVAGVDVTSTGVLQSISNAFISALSLSQGVVGVLVCNPWICAKVRSIDNSGATANFGDSSTGANGATTGPLPPNCALTASWSIASRYRGGHPRSYFPGPPASALDNPGGRVWSSTFISTAHSAFSAFLNSVNTATISGHANGIQLGTIRSKSKGQVIPATFYPYLSVSVHSRVDSQRRRLGKETI